MKKYIAILVSVVFLFAVVGCGSSKVIDGKEYDTVGLLSSLTDDGKQPGIKYEITWGNVFWGVVTFGSIIGPIYFFGFSCAEPVGKLPSPEVKK